MLFKSLTIGLAAFSTASSARPAAPNLDIALGPELGGASLLFTGLYDSSLGLLQQYLGTSANQPAQHDDKQWLRCQAPFPPSTDVLMSTPRLPLGPASPPTDLPSDLALDPVAGAYEQWDFDMIILQNETEFFFTWRTDVDADGKRNSWFETRYVLPDKSVTKHREEGELIYESSGVRAARIGSNRFSWTPDRKFYVVEIDHGDAFRARLFYENVLADAPFSVQPNSTSYELMPDAHLVIPAPRSHVDGWVELNGERWVLQNIGFHSHSWGKVTERNVNRKWSLSRVYAWTISILSLTLEPDHDHAEPEQTVFLSHMHDPLFHIQRHGIDSHHIRFGNVGEPQTGPARGTADLEISWDKVCGEKGLMSIPRKYEIEQGIQTGSGDASQAKLSKTRTKVDLHGSWSDLKSGNKEEIAFGLGYTEDHIGPI